MTKQKTRSNLSVQYMTRIAILGALSAVLFPLEIPIVAFYKLDFSTLPALLGAFSMGPLPGLAILLIKDLSRLAYSSSMYVGELADFIMSAAFILPASLIYRKHKTRKTALVGMAVGTLCMIVVSVLVFAVGWKAHSINPQRNIFILACGFLGVAMLDFSHMLSYAGMPDYITPNLVAKGINFWLPARYLGALSLLWALSLHWHALGESVSERPQRFAVLALVLGCRR